MEKEFTELIKTHEQLILKICNVYCRALADREDLYQDILIQLWKSYPRFNHQSKISTWMYRIALNTAISRYRRVKNKPKSESLSGQQLEAESTTENESFKELYEAIAKLNKLEKAIITLYLDGIKYKEIADILGLSASNVGFKINQIKKKLKKDIKL